MPSGLEDYSYRGNVDITAQTVGNLAVDIAAQTLATLGINITAQSLAELIIKINAQAVGIYLQPEWAALQGIQKTFLCSTMGSYTSYTVPKGKTLYIGTLTCVGLATNSEYGTWETLVEAKVIDWTTTTVLGLIGGEGGGGISFPTPMKALAEHEVRLYLMNNSAHNGNVAGEALMTGYEI